MKIQKIPLAIKVITYQVIFLVFHDLYDWFPNSVTYLLGTISESVFQHMKITLYAYIFLTLIEFALTNHAITYKTRYLYSRLFGAVMIPLLMTVYYLASPAFFVQLNSTLLEIIFANIALIATSLSTFLLADYFAQCDPPRRVKWVLVILFMLMMAESLIFNLRLPWFDIFATPSGW